MLTFIVCPPSAPQIDALVAAGVEHPLAPEFMNAMLRHGSRPVGLWKIVNLLANSQNPDSRAQRRSWRLRYLCACRELLRFRVLYRHGPLIATSNFATRPRPKSPRRLSPSVGGSASRNAGSIPVAPIPKAGQNTSQRFEGEVVTAGKPAVGAAPESKSAAPTPAEISAAAGKLAQRPRRLKRPWTGRLAGERLKRGTLVQVPTGEVLPAYIVVRGCVLVTLPEEPRYAHCPFARYDASQVRRVKLPEAQLLGSMKPRPGSRPRGRPRTAAKGVPMNTTAVAEAGHPA